MADATDRVGPNKQAAAGSVESSPIVRLLAWIVLAIMLIALVYTGWIALANFNRIGV
jgi:hypothetical protein